MHLINYIFNFNTEKYKYREVFEKSFENFKKWNVKIFSINKLNFIGTYHNIIKSKKFQKHYKALISDLPLNYKKINLKKTHLFDIDYTGEKKISFNAEDVLELFTPRLHKGSILVFDEFNCLYFPKETATVIEGLGLKDFEFIQSPYLPFNSVYKFGN